MFKKGSKNVLLLSALVALLLLSFAISAVAAPGAHELITPDQLQGLINSNNVVVVDVRSAADYDAGHIPGAIQVAKEDFFETVGGIPGMAATPGKLAGLLSRIGATPKTHIVIYSADNDTKHAARLWWTLNELYGHKNVQILNGGFQAWTARSYDISTESVTPTPAIYPASELVVNPNAVATKQEVIDALAQESAVVIDCRNQAFYDGTQKKAARAGHIAGTNLVPESDMYNPDYTFKDKQTLRDYFAAKGITKETPVIVYCNTGTTATAQYLALTKIVGCKNVQNYDGSLMEWAADPSLPMEP